MQGNMVQFWELFLAPDYLTAPRMKYNDNTYSVCASRFITNFKHIFDEITLMRIHIFKKAKKQIASFCDGY